MRVVIVVGGVVGLACAQRLAKRGGGIEVQLIDRTLRPDFAPSFLWLMAFDAQQVEPLPSGEPTPLQPPSRPLSGASHAHLIAPTIAFAQSLGYTVSFDPIAGSADGWSNTRAKLIVVDTNGPANARLRTLIHDVIHALGVDYQHYSRAQADVIVDTTTLVVFGGLGLDVSGETVPYVAGWGEDGALDAITQIAQLIDDLARRAEAALSAVGDTQATAATGITRPAWLGCSRRCGYARSSRGKQARRRWQCGRPRVILSERVLDVDARVVTAPATGRCSEVSAAS